MPYNGSGTFNRLYSWVTDRNDGRKIEATRHDAEDDGFATGLSNCLTKDGQSTPTANITLGGFKLTNVGDATTATDAVNRQTGDARYHPIGATTTTDNAIARYNGTAGATQNSGVIISDTDDITGLATITIPNTGLHLLDTNASHDLIIAPGSDLTADRTLTITTGDAARTWTMTGNFTMSGAFNLTLTTTADTNVTLPTTGTLATLAGSETFANKTLTSPVINTGDINGGTADALTSLGIRSTGAAFDLQIANTEVLTANRALTIDLDDAARTMRLQTDLNLSTAGAALIDDADATAQKATLGLVNSTTDNAVIRADGTTGNTQNSGVIIDDSNGVTGISALTAAANTTGTVLTAQSTNGTATTFTGLALDRVSGTPANNDFLSKISFLGRDDGNNSTEYAAIDSQIVDTTNTSEDGKLILRTSNAGSMTDMLTIAAAGLTVGGPLLRTGGVSVEGTNTNDDAAAGRIGEYTSSNIGTGSAVSLTTNVSADVTSISLTAGDWEVWGAVAFNFGASTSITALAGSVNTTTATLGAGGPTATLVQYTTAAQVPGGSRSPFLTVPIARLSLSATTTVYLVVRAVFTVSTADAYGFIAARRVR